MERFELPGDLLVEILLRLPPQQPSCLVRASLVCKNWRALVTDPRFLSRFRAPLVLGAYHNNSLAIGDSVKASGRPDPGPASQFFPPGHGWSVVHDCRHGLVLLTVAIATSLLVWDPMSQEIKQLVPQPPSYGPYFNGFAMVLLPRDDDHASRGGFFRIAAAYVGDDGVAVATEFSSDAGAWGRHVTAKAPAASRSSSMIRRQKPGAAVGDAAVYWLRNDGRVLSLDLQAGLQVLTVLQPRNAPSVFEQNVQLMSTPDGKLGLAAVAGTSLSMWVLDHNNSDGHAKSTWTLRRTLPLDTLLPGATDTSWWPRRRPHPDDEFRRVIRSQGSKLVLARHDDDEQYELPTPCARVVGVHEDGSVVFLRRACGFFMLCLELDTPEIHRMFQTSIMKHDFDTIYPYSAPSSNVFSGAINI